MGTSSVSSYLFLRGEDHPHAYGDKFATFCFGQLIAGSSPRVWGQVKNIGAVPFVVRIIPTRMGTSYNVTTDSFGN